MQMRSMWYGMALGCFKSCVKGLRARWQSLEKEKFDEDLSKKPGLRRNFVRGSPDGTWEENLKGGKAVDELHQKVGGT